MSLTTASSGPPSGNKKVKKQLQLGGLSSLSSDWCMVDDNSGDSFSHFDPAVHAKIEFYDNMASHLNRITKEMYNETKQ